MLSSRFAPYDAAKGKDSGADENLEKPFDTAQAIEKVKKVLSARESGAEVAVATGAPVAAAAAAPAASVAAKPPAAAKPAAAAVAPVAARAPEPVKPAAAAAKAAPAIANATNGKHMAAKLADLGLNPQQVDAVMALSRQVIEEVVWEVVPSLASTIIREEISRLTKE
jgi:hypothetical protein